MPAKSSPAAKRRQPDPFDPTRVTREFKNRRNQVKRRLVELAGIQHRSERLGDHRTAARALRERRYLQFVSRLLDETGAHPSLRHAA
jgi:hypothetical protein